LKNNQFHDSLILMNATDLITALLLNIGAALIYHILEKWGPCLLKK